MNYITLFDLIIQEYFSIMEYLIKKAEIQNDKIILDNAVFNIFLDKNLYIKRIDKLRIYKQLNIITCDKNGFSMAMYDKKSKKTKRKIVVNIKTYETIKALYNTTIDN